jgi:hypothetical protein
MVGFVRVLKFVQKENKMFDFKNTVDTVAKASKNPLMYVENKGLRGSLETVVDTHAEFVKTMHDTNLEIVKQMIESVKGFDFAKTFAAAK